MAKPVIVAGDCTNSGSSTAQATWAVNFPAAVAGDLLVVCLGWDDSTTCASVTTPTGPNGEVFSSIAGPVASNGTEVRQQCWWTVVLGTWGSGTRTFTPAATEQWSATVIKVLKGGFDATVPIGGLAHTAASAGTAETNVNSPAYTAGATDGMGAVIAHLVSDADAISAAPSGWTNLQNQNIGGIIGQCTAIRTAESKNSTSVAAATWTIAGDSWCSIGFIVRGPLPVTSNASLVVNNKSPTVSVNLASGATGQITWARLFAPFASSLVANTDASSLILTGQSPKVSVHVSTGVASLVLTTGTPSLISGTVKAPASASLTLTGKQTTAFVESKVSPGAASLVLTGAKPGLSPTATPGQANLSLTGKTPTVSVHVSTSAGSLTLTGGQPQVGGNFVIPVGKASLILTGQTVTASSSAGEVGRITWARFIAPWAGAMTSVSVPAASLTLTGRQPVSVASHVIDVFGASPYVWLTWDAVPGATGYRIGVDVDSGVPYAQEMDVGNVLEFKTGPWPPGRWYFNVLAYDGSGDGAWNTELPWDSSGLIITGQQPVIAVAQKIAITSQGNLLLTGQTPTVSKHISVPAASLVLTGKQVSGGPTLTIPVGVASLVLTGSLPTLSSSGHITVPASTANLVLSGQVPVLAQTGHVFKATDAAQLVLTASGPAVLMSGSFAIDIQSANLYLDGQLPTVEGPYVGSWQKPAGGASRKRDRQRENRRRWVLPNGLHVFGTADQALEIAQSIISHPVVVRERKPRKPVTIRFDDGDVLADVVYPTTQQTSAQATDPLVAQTQTAGPDWISAEQVMKMLEERKRRRRKAAALLLLS